MELWIQTRSQKILENVPVWEFYNINMQIGCITFQFDVYDVEPVIPLVDAIEISQKKT